MSADHRVEIVTTLAAKADRDVFTAACSCGWRGKRRVAGKDRAGTWSKAVDEAEAHAAAP